jgi:hypothetical protein
LKETTRGEDENNREKQLASFHDQIGGAINSAVASKSASITGSDEAVVRNFFYPACRCHRGAPVIFCLKMFTLIAAAEMLHCMPLHLTNERLVVGQLS